MLKIMEWDSGGGAENDEYMCIEAAPRRMRMASRREMTRKRERSPRMALVFEGKGGRRGGTAGQRQGNLNDAIHGTNGSGPLARGPDTLLYLIKIA